MAVHGGEEGGQGGGDAPGSLTEAGPGAGGTEDADGGDGEAQPPAASLAGLLVLVARPDSPQSRADASALVDAGAELVFAGNVGTLLRLADRIRPVLVVLDAALLGAEPRQAVAALTTGAGAGALRIVAGSGLSSAARARLLRWGADDCLSCPYSPLELLARVEALLRRAPAAPPPPPSMADLLVSGGLRVDVARHTVHVAEAQVALTPLEFDLLAYLLRHPDVVLSRERLLTEVWGYSFGGTDTVTVHMRRLRTKVEADPSRPQRIQTVWGLGYQYTPDT